MTSDSVFKGQDSKDRNNLENKDSNVFSDISDVRYIDKLINEIEAVYRDPFRLGWRREVVFRSINKHKGARAMADVYYHSPEGKKLRSLYEISQYCKYCS